MRLPPLSAFMLLSTVGCDHHNIQTPVPIQPYQRFVPLPPPQAQMVGIPWTGFFALDTQLGQLCRTSGLYGPKSYSALPTCEVDLQTYPTPGQVAPAAHK